MRPIERPWHDVDERYYRRVGPRLLTALGDYCSFCERPLPGELWVLDPRTGEVGEWDDPGSYWWPAPLLACHNCRDAHLTSGTDALRLLLFPDDDRLSFRVGDGSPLTYALEPVRMVMVEEDGTEAVSVVERVIVSGSTDAARATIRHFGLNTDYHDPASGSFRIPVADALRGADRRVDQRTDAWRTVTSIALTAGSASRELRDALLDQLRMIVSGLGFWSTCATALRAAMGPDAPLARVLLGEGSPALPRGERTREPPLPRQPQAIRPDLRRESAAGPPLEALFDVEPPVLSEVEFTGPGSHNPFPGTRPDALA